MSHISACAHAQIQSLAHMVPLVFAGAGCELAGLKAKHLAIVIIHLSEEGGVQSKTGVTQGSPMYGMQGAG